MSKLISKKSWDNFKNVINSASETFNQTVVIWKKSKGGLDRFMEDNENERFENIELNALAEYNKNRVWPTTFYTETGEIDRESEVLLFNINYLKNLGHINNNGNFTFEPSTDRIIHKGIIYKCSGITPLSQAADEDLLIQLILQKEVIGSQNPTH
mgnify:CR=1 FL=1